VLANCPPGCKMAHFHLALFTGNLKSLSSKLTKIKAQSTLLLRLYGEIFSIFGACTMVTKSFTSMESLTGRQNGKLTWILYRDGEMGRLVCR
jgi:hypothetical protein